MLAVRYHGIQDVRVEEVPKPACGPRQALVRVRYAGICGSDLHIYRQGMFVAHTPEIMGHEFCGVVEEVGPEVDAVRPGDHVVGDPRVGCGTCPYCRRGDFNLCPELSFIGEIAPGCLAEYLVLDARRLLVVPPGVEMRQAALVEPLAVALHIADRGGFAGNDHLGIIGAGPIGLLTLLVAREIYRVRSVSVVDLSQHRLDLARKLGADAVGRQVPRDRDDWVDAAVEAVGIEATLRGALRWLKPGGRLVLAGLYENLVQLDPNDAVGKELRISGINAYTTADLQRAVGILAGQELDLTPLISHILPLAEAPGCFARLARGDWAAAKILLAPGAEKGVADV